MVDWIKKKNLRKKVEKCVDVVNYKFTGKTRSGYVLTHIPLFETKHEFE